MRHGNPEDEEKALNVALNSDPTYEAWKPAPHVIRRGVRVALRSYL